MSINISGAGAITIAKGFEGSIEGEVRDATGAPILGAVVTFGVGPIHTTGAPTPPPGGVPVEFLEPDAWGRPVARHAAGTTTDERLGMFRVALRGAHEGQCRVIIRCGPENAEVLVEVVPSAVVAAVPGVGAVVQGSDGRMYAVRGSAVAAGTPGGAATLLLGSPQQPTGPNIIVIDV